VGASSLSKKREAVAQLTKKKANANWAILGGWKRGRCVGSGRGREMCLCSEESTDYRQSLWKEGRGGKGYTKGGTPLCVRN